MLVGFEISFDGVTASAVPALVEVGTVVAGRRPAPRPGRRRRRCRVRGQTIAHGCTISHNYSSEPTTIVPAYDWWLDPNKGVFDRLWPLGRELEAGRVEGDRLPGATPPPS